MGLRKAAAYSKKRVRPYTRKSTKKAKSYIKTIPQNKIVKFKMGQLKDFDNGKLKFIVKLISGEKVLIRDHALEACRQFIHKRLDTGLTGQYYFEVKPYPHHILRENKVLTGAGADRMQTGMQKSFGSSMGRAAIVKSKKEIFKVAVHNEKARLFAMKVLVQIKSKIPCKSRLMMEKLE